MSISYLDNAATTKLFSVGVESMLHTIQNIYGNPSSLHRLGVDAAEALESSRKIIADQANVSPDSVIFTSGATEANQTVLRCGVHKPNRKRNHILMSSFEHPSVSSTKEYLEEMGYEVELIIPDQLGFISTKNIAEKMRDTTELVSIIGVHNELGVVQDIKQIKNVIKEINSKTLFHVDGAQWFGKIPMPSSEDLPDYFTISGHKFHAPRGIGAIIKNTNTPLKPLIKGGGQENKFRSGTENLPAITAMAAVVKELDSNKNLSDEIAISSQKKLFDQVTSIDNIRWLGPKPGFGKSPFVNLIAIKNKKSEILIHQLEKNGIYVSSGSACSDKSNKNNDKMNFLNLDESFSDGILRISFCYETKESDIDNFIKELLKLL